MDWHWWGDLAERTTHWLMGPWSWDSLSLQPLEEANIKAARLSGMVMPAKYVCNGTRLLELLLQRIRPVYPDGGERPHPGLIGCERYSGLLLMTALRVFCEP